MSRHPVPTDSASLALTIATDAARVRQAQEGFTTVASIDAALAAMMRVRSNSSEMCLQLRRQRAAALIAEREAATRRPTQPMLQGARV